VSGRGQGEEVFTEPVGVQRFEDRGGVLGRVAGSMVVDDLIGGLRGGRQSGEGERGLAVMAGQGSGKGGHVHGAAHHRRGGDHAVLGAGVQRLPVGVFPAQ
jgi:hypothetical protein